MQFQDLVNDSIKERNICGTYIDAIFRPAFEDPSANNHFVWSDIQVINRPNKQPDFISRAIMNISWCEPVVIGEAKGEDQAKDLFETLLDLIRIGHLTKQSIDNNLYDAVLGIHVVASHTPLLRKMYLDEIENKLWNIQDAISIYEIKFRDKKTTIAKLKQHLRVNIKNPNLRKVCQEDSHRMLEKLIAIDVCIPELSKSTKNTQARPSIRIVQKNNGTVNMKFQGNTHIVKKRKAIDAINIEKDEVDRLFNNVQTDAVTDEFSDVSPVFLRLQKDVKIVRPKTNWIVDGVNFTAKYLSFQERCIELANKSSFILETHAREVLMLSSILLVKPHQHSDFLSQHFKSEELDMLRERVMDGVCADIYFNENVTSKLTQITKDLNKNLIGREDAVTKLCQFKADLTRNEYRLVDSVINLFNKLPNLPIINPLGETELTCGYIDPVVFPMFTDYSKYSKLIWPNLIQKESKTSTVDVNSSRRPDAVIRVLHQHNYADPRGFGEVKTLQRKEESYELIRDLIRCNIFSKEAVDIHSMNGNVFFQVIGYRVSFNIFTLKADGIYVAVEICIVEIPSSLQTLPLFITHLDDLIPTKA